jgi:hypothetical protein
MDFLDWFLLLWVVASVIATPLVGRLVAARIGDPPAEEPVTPHLGNTAHD